MKISRGVLPSHTRVCALALFLLISGAIGSFGQVPNLINYQGRLVSGTNLVSGTVGLSLRLFPTPTGGTLLYEDSNTVSVVDGLYATAIGDDTTFGSLITALTNSTVYLEVAVNGAPLSPREEVIAVPYALNTRGLSLTPTWSVVMNPIYQNVANFGFFNVVGGGFFNTVTSASYSTIGGGRSNTITTMDSAIGGGFKNFIFGDSGTIAGGAYNAASARSAVGGGVSNSALVGSSTVAGGAHNRVQSVGGAIAGGQHNLTTLASTNGAIGGGSFNQISGSHGTIPGGYGNTAGAHSFAAGTFASAEDSGTFVWADLQPTMFSSTDTNQFLVRAVNGVGINTNAPRATLHVAGEAVVGPLTNAAKFGVVRVSAFSSGVFYQHPFFPDLQLSWNSTSRILSVVNLNSGIWFDAAIQVINNAGVFGNARDIMSAIRPSVSLTNSALSAGWHVIAVREGSPGPGFTFQGTGYDNLIQGLITYWE